MKLLEKRPLPSGCFPQIGSANIASQLILTWDLSESQHQNKMLNAEPREKLLAHGNPSIMLRP